MINNEAAASMDLIRGLDRSRPADLILVNAPLPNASEQPGEKTPLPALGIGYVATTAAQYFNVGVLDGQAEGLTPQQIADAVNECEPKWVGLNPLAPTYETTAEIAVALDRRTKLMLGGHQVKAMPIETMSDSRFDRVEALILGEAETRVQSLLLSDLVYGEDNRAELPGVVWRHSDTGRIIVNGPNINNEEKFYTAPHLGRSPFIDRNFLKSEPRFENGRWEANMVGARGCPYNCSFCGAAVSANPDILIRSRSPRDIMEEMDFQYLANGVTAFRFVDDLFLGHKRFIESCTQAFSSEELGYKYVWDATGRINILNRLDDALLDSLASNGCREIALGIESGSSRVLGHIDKRIEPDMIKSVVDRLTKRGINVKGYFILGLPTETREEMGETVRLIQDLWDLTDNNPGQFRTSVFEFRPYPGTPEWDRLMLTGKYTTKQLLDYTAVDLTGLDKAMHVRDEFNFSVGLQFGEATLSEIRETLTYLTREQFLRRQHVPAVENFVDQDWAKRQPARWNRLIHQRNDALRDNATSTNPRALAKAMRLLAHDFHMDIDPTYKDEWWGREYGRTNWIVANLERFYRAA